MGAGSDPVRGDQCGEVDTRRGIVGGPCCDTVKFSTIDSGFPQEMGTYPQSRCGIKDDVRAGQASEPPDRDSRIAAIR